MLAKLLTRLLQGRERSGFHSRFGGLWTDRVDAEERLRTLPISEDLRSRLASWIQDGFVVLPGGAATELVDTVRAEQLALEGGPAGSGKLEVDGRYLESPRGPWPRGAKLLDHYATSTAARALAFSPPAVEFLRWLFEDDPLLFQSLTFREGSEQPLHQDTAYVVVTPPLEFAAAWIALEDVQPGTGELFYYPGSHRLDEATFGPGVRNWNRGRDGREAQSYYHRRLVERAEERGLERRVFLPRKGDVLLWSADLAHGGLPVEDHAATRRSYVCHYCPVRARPYWFHFRPDRSKRHEHAPGETFASRHHGVVDLPRPGQ